MPGGLGGVVRPALFGAHVVDSQHHASRAGVDAGAAAALGLISLAQSAISPE
jgi:hypothetical protein